MQEAKARQDEHKAGQLRFALGLTACVLGVEIAGGLWTRSLALLSDAGHVFSDVSSLALSLLALRLAARPPTSRHSYGLHRAEVLAALANGLGLLAICALILREAYSRFQQPPEVRSMEMLAIAAVGLVANWVVAGRLHGHSREDINLRSAYLHVVGDLLASIGVVVAAAIIALTGWQMVDPLLSVLIALIILVGAVRVTGEAVHVLLEGVPAGVDLETVAREMSGVEGVLGVHHVHAWSVCSNVTALSGHVVVSPEQDSQRDRVRRELEDLLRERHGFVHTTLQVECEEREHGQDLLRQYAHGPKTGHSHAHEHGHAHENGQENHADHTDEGSGSRTP